MKGKLTRAFALGFVLGTTVMLTGCSTAPSQELSIIDAVSTGSLAQPQSCAAKNAATVCVQTMRLNRDKECGCVDRRDLADGRFAPF